jgi:hypothetical protein
MLLVPQPPFLVCSPQEITLQDSPDIRLLQLTGKTGTRMLTLLQIHMMCTGIIFGAHASRTRLKFLPGFISKTGEHKIKPLRKARPGQ